MRPVPTVQDIALDPPADGVLVDPMTWYASPGPFEIEIGCGKGGFLLARARARPDVRLLGIEWANKYFKFAADRMARWNVSNVRVMRTDAARFVMDHLPPECVSAIHLYHPDPWPKKRHHKRRLVQADFAAAAVRSLSIGGYWLIQTDHEEYHEQIRCVLTASPGLREIPWVDAEPARVPAWPGTNYEIKYTREGRSIERVACQRIPM